MLNSSKGHKVSQEIIPTHFYISSLTHWYKAGWNHAFMLYMQTLSPACSSRNQDWWEQAMFFITFQLQKIVPSFSAAHLLQGSRHCAFRFALMHTLVVTSGCLSYCCLSQRTVVCWIHSFFWTSLCKLRGWFCRNIPANYHFLKSGHLPPATMLCSKALK